MKKTLIPSIILLVLLCTGCDALRKLAGRPTSEDIENIRQELIAREEARRQAVLDSIARVEKAREDSIAAVRALEQERRENGYTKAEYPYKYAVRVGSFSQVENARNKAAQMREAGYEADLIRLTNGHVAVYVNGTNNLQYAKNSVEKIKGENLCSDATFVQK